MSDATHPPGLATARPTSKVVKTGPFVIRHLAPGKPYLELRDGQYVLVRPANSDEMPRISLTKRARYRFNYWLTTQDGSWSIASLILPGTRQLAGKSARTKRVHANWHTLFASTLRSRARSILSIDVKALGRGALMALLAFMSLIGATRFIHVDVRTVLQSVQFSVPKFLTPWRSDDDFSLVTPGDRGITLAATPYFGNITPSTFTPIATVSSPAVEDASRGRKADPNWLPLPGGGPFPMNMPDYATDGQKKPFAGTIRAPIFTPPDEHIDDEAGAGSAVTLLGPAATVASGAAEPTTNKDGGSRAAVAPPTQEPGTAREKGRPVQQPKHQPSPTIQQAQAPSRDTVDVQLWPAPAQMTAMATRKQNDDSQDKQEQAGTSDGKPKFKVVTKNDDALVVMDNGQMKQISVGQTLPDGSTLLSVKQNGGGFTTSRGNFVAY